MVELLGKWESGLEWESVYSFKGFSSLWVTSKVLAMVLPKTD